MSQYGRILLNVFLTFCLALLAIGFGAGYATRAWSQVLAETNISEAAPLTSYANVRAPNGKPAAVLWGAGNVLANTSGALWMCTGWNPPEPRRYWQVSTVPEAPCATGIQGQGRHVGLNVHSPSIAGLALRNWLGTIVYGVTFGGKTAPRPFASGKRVVSTFDIIVPSVGYGSWTNEQAVYYYSFVDTVTKRAIWVGLPIFDRRGFPVPYMIDAETRMPIVMLQGQPHYRQTFTAWQRYVFAVGWPQISQHLGGNPADVVVGMAGIQLETYTPGGQWARIGATMKEWRVELAGP